MEPNKKLKIAIIGGGVAGLTASYLLQPRHDVTLFEKNDYIGGHTHTISIPSGPDEGLPVDTGFIVYNDKNYPTFVRLLERLGIQGVPSDMSFGFSNGDLEYSSYFPSGLFAQKRNLLRSSFLGMIRDILRFNKQAVRDLAEGRLQGLSLGGYMEKIRMGEAFRNHYLLPMTSAVWSTSPNEMMEFPAEMFARFFFNHGLLSIGKRPQWKTIPGGSRCYVEKILQRLSGKYQIGNPVVSLKRNGRSVSVRTAAGEESVFDAAVVATHADEALKLLSDPSPEETRLLGPWSYSANHTILHTDQSIMPKRKKAWASWNYTAEKRMDAGEQVTLTYYMNRLQPLASLRSYFVTLNTKRDIPKDKIIQEIHYTHPRYTFSSLKTQPGLSQLNGANRTYFCGSYFHNGFHEDAVKSAAAVCALFGETL